MTRNEVLKAIGQQLRYLRHNLKSINVLLDRGHCDRFQLGTRDQKIFWVIQNIYDQQELIYKDHIHSIENRQWLKELGIRYSGKPLGRPSAKKQTAYQKRKFIREQGKRMFLQVLAPLSIHPEI